MPPRTITIDGPAASGKSSAGWRLATRLEYLFLDTGALYRAVTLLALERGVPFEDPDDGRRLGELAATTRIDVLPPAVADAGPSSFDSDAATTTDDRRYTVRIGPRDVTPALHRPAIDAAVSAVSAHPPVRAALIEQQRRIGRAGDVVMIGRDIGTVVLPDADLKFYLDASLEERARRRYEEYRAQGRAPSYQAILGAMQKRDTIDSSRASAPLRRADDAIYLDTTGYSLEVVVEKLLAFVFDD